MGENLLIKFHTDTCSTEFTAGLRPSPYSTASSETNVSSNRGFPTKKMLFVDTFAVSDRFPSSVRTSTSIYQISPKSRRISKKSPSTRKSIGFTKSTRSSAFDIARVIGEQDKLHLLFEMETSPSESSQAPQLQPEPTNSTGSNKNIEIVTPSALPGYFGSQSSSKHLSNSSDPLHVQTEVDDDKLTASYLKDFTGADRGVSTIGLGEQPERTEQNQKQQRVKKRLKTEELPHTTVSVSSFRDYSYLNPTSHSSTKTVDFDIQQPTKSNGSTSSSNGYIRSSSLPLLPTPYENQIDIESTTRSTYSKARKNEREKSKRRLVSQLVDDLGEVMYPNDYFDPTSYGRATKVDKATLLENSATKIKELKRKLEELKEENQELYKILDNDI